MFRCRRSSLVLIPLWTRPNTMSFLCIICDKWPRFLNNFSLNLNSIIHGQLNSKWCEGLLQTLGGEDQLPSGHRTVRNFEDVLFSMAMCGFQHCSTVGCHIKTQQQFRVVGNHLLRCRGSCDMLSFNCRWKMINQKWGEQKKKPEHYVVFFFLFVCAEYICISTLFEQQQKKKKKKWHI